MSGGERAVIVVVILIGVIVIAAVVGGFYYYSSIARTSTVPPSSSSPVVITGINLEISYAFSSDNYFGPRSQSLGGTGMPLSLQNGQSFYYSFKLIMGGLYQSHNIDSVTLTTAGFTLMSVNPSLPYSMSSGSSVTITITAQAPISEFYGAVTISVTTH